MNLGRFIAALLLLTLTCSVGARDMQIKRFEPDSLEQIMAGHRGKPFLLFVWSMDCEFCQASLDILSRARAADPGLIVVTLTTDPLSDSVLAAQVHKRLAALKLLRHAWAFGDDSPERLRFALDPSWRGEKPRSYWYDGKGNRRAYSGMLSSARLAQWRRQPVQPVSDK